MAADWLAGWLVGCVAGWGLLIIYESDTGWTRTEIDESVTKGHTGDGSVDRIMSNYHLRPPLTPSYGGLAGLVDKKEDLGDY